MEQLYDSVRDASERTGIPIGNFYRLIAKGELPVGIYARLGSRIFIHRERLEQWLANGGMVEPVQEAS